MAEATMTSMPTTPCNTFLNGVLPVLTPETPGVVIPAQPHEVELLPPVRPFVEFFSARNVEGGPHAK
jgi:hypothetical protein